MSIFRNDSPEFFSARATWKIAGAYAAFAALWILLSDQLLILLVSDPNQIALISTAKGWCFVAVTSLLLSLLVRRYLDKLVAANNQLQISEERWKLALAGVGDGVWDWNFETGGAQFSKQWKEMLGFSDSEIENNASEWETRVHPEDMPNVMRLIQKHIDGETPTAVVEYRLRCKDGTWKWVLGRGMVVSRTPDGKPLRMVGTNIDISERKFTEIQVQQQAFYDPLTNLPNRRLLNDRLNQALASSKRSGCYGALMFLDLDNFKALNDAHGHQVGDLLLIEVADRLRACIREMDTLSRFGGDEFVVIAGDLTIDKAESTAEAAVIAEKVLSTLSEPYRIVTKNDEGGDISIEHNCTVSIGIRLFLNSEASASDVLKSADKAMYQAKEAGRSRIKFCVLDL
jgi:diguanylate cyclase (GGDEF)-like protein/PAS domain S-box-containing protein